MHLYPIDGAVHDVASEATAFAYRDANFAPVIAGMWLDPADNDANIKWVREYHAALEPHTSDGGYINFMAEDDQSRIRANYGTIYERLTAVKKAYDPTNLFHLNQKHRSGGVDPRARTKRGTSTSALKWGCSLPARQRVLRAPLNFVELVACRQVLQRMSLAKGPISIRWFVTVDRPPCAVPPAGPHSRPSP